MNCQVTVTLPWQFCMYLYMDVYEQNKKKKVNASPCAASCRHFKWHYTTLLSHHHMMTLKNPCFGVFCMHSKKDLQMWAKNPTIKIYNSLIWFLVILLFYVSCGWYPGSVWEWRWLLFDAINSILNKHSQYSLLPGHLSIETAHSQVHVNSAATTCRHNGQT